MLITTIYIDGSEGRNAKEAFDYFVKNNPRYSAIEDYFVAESEDPTAWSIYQVVHK